MRLCSWCDNPAVVKGIDSSGWSDYACEDHIEEYFYGYSWFEMEGVK